MRGADAPSAGRLGTYDRGSTVGASARAILVVRIKERVNSCASGGGLEYRQSVLKERIRVRRKREAWRREGVDVRSAPRRASWGPASAQRRERSLEDPSDISGRRHLRSIRYRKD